VPGCGTAGWPIEADGETWRWLKVAFPDHIKSHTREQISCFGPVGLLRRRDFTIGILGGAPGLPYAMTIGGTLHVLVKRAVVRSRDRSAGSPGAVDHSAVR
jgi:hypothetical protein